jgi:hypothetical protein
LDWAIPDRTRREQIIDVSGHPGWLVQHCVMPTIRLTETTTVSPDRFIAALTDFGPQRGEVWTNSTPEYLQVHSLSETSADVTEGSSAGGGTWERLRYDWSTPGHVTMATIDSNIWGRASGHDYSVLPNRDGGSTIHVVIVRQGRNVKGVLIGALAALIGKPYIRRELRKSIAVIEAS